MLKTKRKIQIICLAFLLMVAVVLSSVTYSRYKSTVEKSFTFQAKTLAQTGSYSISSQNGWQKTSNGMVLDFTLSKSAKATSNLAAYLRLTATEGLSQSVTVILTVDSTTYSAKSETISEGNILYTQMGGGKEYSFHTANGELSFQINEAKSMRITVQGASEQALLRLMLVEK